MAKLNELRHGGFCGRCGIRTRGAIASPTGFGVQRLKPLEPTLVNLAREANQGSVAVTYKCKGSNGSSQFIAFPDGTRISTLV